jgi:hypothetical protein
MGGRGGEREREKEMTPHGGEGGRDERRGREGERAKKSA